MILLKPRESHTASLRQTLTAHPQVWPILSRAHLLRRSDWRGFNRLSAELRRIVGWEARDPQLATPQAYETAHQLLEAAMGQARQW